MKPLTRSRPARGALMAASAVVALAPSVAAPSPTGAAVTSVPGAARGLQARTGTTARPRADRTGPTLDRLPDLLGRDAARRVPLTIAVAQRPSATSLRAAILAAGAVQRAAGTRGVQVDVLRHPTATALRAAPGTEIVIDERTGAASLSLAGSSPGHVRLTIAGTGDGLLTAARLLSDPAIRAFNARTATVPAGLVTAVASDPAPASVRVDPAGVSGRGPLSLTTGFTLPIDRQLVGDSSLKILTGYDAAGGGRVSARLQGGALGATDTRGPAAPRVQLTARFSNDPALTGDTLPGWWAHPGLNRVTLTASPARRGAPATLQVLPGSRVSLQTSRRPPALALGLWPFPIYDDHAWSRATVVLDRSPSSRMLSALITALANTERITGVTPDPAVALAAPSAEQARGNLIVTGAAARAAGAGRLPGLGDLHATQTPLAGTLEETRLASGAVALLADGPRALTALGPQYALGSVSGRAALVDAGGHAHTLAAGQAIRTFAAPRLPWLAPLAFLAVLALGWIGVRTVRAQRRVAGMPALDLGRRGGGS